MGIVNTGLAELANLTIGSGTAFSYLAIGTGTTDEANDQTALVTEYLRQSATVSRITTTVTNDTSQFKTTFTADATKAITELGVFNASSSGVMLLRAKIGVINLDNGDALELTVKLKHNR